jgi:transposase
MYLCVLDAHGSIVLHRRIPSQRDAFLEAIEPYRDDLVVCAECIFCWYWLADLCSELEVALVLAHALYLKAIHGGKAKNDRIDSEKLATLLRGGSIPQAYVDPPRMRSTRDLLRRRLHFRRKRAELLSHIQNTFHQYNLPKPERQRLENPAYRGDVIDAFDDVSVRASIQADLVLCGHYETLLKDLERTVLRQARQHEPNTLHLLQTIPGVGKILSLTLLYELHTIERFGSVQQFASYARLVKSPHTSDGKRVGSGGAKIGNAHLKWAFSEAAVCFLQRNPPAHAWMNRLRSKHGKGKALSILAAKLGRATYFMLKRNQAFDMDRFLMN